MKPVLVDSWACSQIQTRGNHFGIGSICSDHIEIKKGEEILKDIKTLKLISIKHLQKK